MLELQSLGQDLDYGQDISLRMHYSTMLAWVQGEEPRLLRSLERDQLLMKMKLPQSVIKRLPHPQQKNSPTADDKKHGKKPQKPI
jgi:hypothetical protein